MFFNYYCCYYYCYCYYCYCYYYYHYTATTTMYFYYCCCYYYYYCYYCYCCCYCHFYHYCYYYCYYCYVPLLLRVKTNKKNKKYCWGFRSQLLRTKNPLKIRFVSDSKTYGGFASLTSASAITLGCGPLALKY